MWGSSWYTCKLMQPATLLLAALGPTQPPVRWAPGCFPGVKRPARVDDHPSPSSAEVKDSPFCAFMACSRLSFIFTFHPVISLEEWGKTIKASVSVTNFGAEDWTLAYPLRNGSANRCVRSWGFVTRLSGRCLENSIRNLFAFFFLGVTCLLSLSCFSPLSFPKSKTSSYDQKS